ncbi:MAG TPA: cell envelope biogenesis protein OmpA, partial [Chitinophagaceae bacterium]|nr:cell envelope biogenesis protein OmpA [Chitinophagaceae bacterium]
CPIPDTDGDGVNDEEDKCPKVPGDKANFGCPKIEASVKLNNIQFKTGSAVLLPIALKELKKVNDYLKANTGFDVVVEGHTDNVGKPANNKVLSQKRAQSVVNYLVKLGTPKERLSAMGYGSEQPVADNKTAAGRTQNRRVAFKIKG